MMKRNVKKPALIVRKEVIRVLSSKELHGVAGGDVCLTSITCSKLPECGGNTGAAQTCE